MKRIVNGVEIELLPVPGVEIHPLEDRLMVHTPEGAFSATIQRIGEATHVSYQGRLYVVERPGKAKSGSSPATSGEVRAPMPGQIVEVYGAAGDVVAAGAKILVLEAMKTQQTFTAPIAGTLSEIRTTKGAQVTEGQILFTVAPTLPQE